MKAKPKGGRRSRKPFEQATHSAGFKIAAVIQEWPGLFQVWKEQDCSIYAQMSTNLRDRMAKIRDGAQLLADFDTLELMSACYRIGEKNSDS